MAYEAQSNDQTPPAQPAGRTVGIIDVLLVLAIHKRLILGLPALTAVVSIVVALLLPRYYTGTTKILPPQQTQSTSAVLAQLGNLAGLTGAAAAAALKNPNDLYVGMLKSRTIADNLIERFDLNKLYESDYQSETRKRLAKETTITAGKDGIITIQVDDRDPKRSADLANGYVEELFKLTKVLAVTEASQRRLFFERQMNEAKNNLVRSQIAARQAIDKGGIIQVEGQGRTLLEMTARLRAQITVKEIQVGVMRSYATAQNPELQRNQQELDIMKRELERIEGNSAGKSNPGKVSEEGIDNLGLLRDMKYYEATYDLLVKQYEIAKIDEAKDSALIQVMDRAIEPDRKTGPKRSLIVLLWTLVAGVLAVLIAFIKEALAKAKDDPRTAEQMAHLRAYLGLRGRRSP